MLFISDVHHGLVSLKNLPNTKEPIVILGDLINWIDYRNGEGIAQDVFGKDIVVRLIQLRKDHNFEERKKLWSSMFEKDQEEVQLKLEQAIYRQYQEVFKTLKNYEVLIIPGNVDSEKIIKETMTNNVNYVDGKVINYKHFKIGFAGGGVPTPINARGEISEEVFSLKLKQLGEVDIICTHAPPYVKELITDVITNKKRTRVGKLKENIPMKKNLNILYSEMSINLKPSKWRLGTTDCLNVGYFRANSNYLELASLIA